MAELTVNGIRVHYRQSGGGPPVVLLHGGGSSGAQWRRVCEALGDRYRTVTVDHYGHGGTQPWPGPPEVHTHDEEAVLVRAVMDTLGEPAHLVGQSYGGGVALRMAVTDPAGVRSLTLIEPIALSVLKHGGESELAHGYEDFAQAFLRDAKAGDAEGAWQRFLDGNGAPGTWAAMAPEQRRRLIDSTEAIAANWHANLNHATTPEECRAVALPTLLVHGGQTKPHFRRIVELLAGLIPGSRHVELSEAGHMSPLTHPDALVEALAPHLAAN